MDEQINDSLFTGEQTTEGSQEKPNAGIPEKQPKTDPEYVQYLEWKKNQSSQNKELEESRKAVFDKQRQEQSIQESADAYLKIKSLLERFKDPIEGQDETFREVMKSTLEAINNSPSESYISKAKRMENTVLTESLKNDKFLTAEEKLICKDLEAFDLLTNKAKEIQAEKNKLSASNRVGSSAGGVQYSLLQKMIDKKNFVFKNAI